jgi:hypothetical protein
MSVAKIYRQYAYIAGVQVPILSTVIASTLGSLASLNVSINYSPYITRIHEYAKIQIWEQIIDGGVINEPTLEFDGIIIGVQRKRNLLGEVFVSLSCLTDGAIWNIRKRSDFYLQNIASSDYRGTGDVLNMRADGQITNFFAETLQQNQFDIGCSIASILTSHIHSQTDTTSNPPTSATSYYEYSFNGKIYTKKVLSDGSSSDNASNPKYYDRFLCDYKLANKVYGVSTSANLKNYFNVDTFVKLVTNTDNDVYGENTFWQLAMTISRYGFFNVYDIPNPTFIDTDGGSDKIDVETLLPSEKLTKITKDANGKVLDLSIDPHPEVVTVLSPTNSKTYGVELKNKKSYKGLAEYIFKPISVMGIPFQCNVIWPDQVLEESVFFDYFNTPTRVLYQRKEIPGVDSNILTCQVIVGPNYNSNDYLKSLTLPNIVPGNLREVDAYSEYESEYGIKYTRLDLSYAFDSSLLKNLDNSQDSINKINNYLNYEFAQNFLGTRKYSVMVTPDCNPIPGFPLVVLNKMGEHVIAFCTGIRKAWSATGQKNISLDVAYPRYYFEDFGDLGNVIDTISQNQMSLDEMGKLIGSKPLDGLSVAKKSYTDVKNAITTLFSKYQDSDKDALDALKKKYNRSVCTYKQYMDLNGITVANDSIKDMPTTYGGKLFDSSIAANNFSTHYFEVYDTINKKPVPLPHLSNSDIINLHLDWIKNPKRI